MEDSEEEGDDAMIEDNVVRPHKMGRDNFMRSDEAEDNLIRSEQEEAEEEEAEEEEQELGDVMSHLFEWDFDQLLRQVGKLFY